jgi:hypothetical protein
MAQKISPEKCATAIDRLHYLLDIIPPLLRQIPVETFGHKPAAEKWSKKEILGHLIDSATNNHQRFVRGQFENEPFITYDQNNWNTHSRYADMDGEHVISFWVAYNKHLLEVIKRIPAAAFERKCITNEAAPVTLAWLIDDYVKHMEHHLKQLVAY